eukprot:15472737-Alexandrium_andersonii.AAC.1
MAEAARGGSRVGSDEAPEPASNVAVEGYPSFNSLALRLITCMRGDACAHHCVRTLVHTPYCLRKCEQHVGECSLPSGTVDLGSVQVLSVASPACAPIAPERAHAQRVRAEGGGGLLCTRSRQPPAKTHRI